MAGGSRIGVVMFEPCITDGWGLTQSRVLALMRDDPLVFEEAGPATNKISFFRAIHNLI